MTPLAMEDPPAGKRTSCIFEKTPQTMVQMWIQHFGLSLDSDAIVCTLNSYALCLNTVYFSVESGISFLSEPNVFR